MNYSESPIYSSIMNKINEYQMAHSCKPERIKMSNATNKKLTNEMNYVRGKGSILSISIIFGLHIEIDSTFYDFEIVILGKKNETKK